LTCIWPLEHGVFRHRPNAEEEAASLESDREAEAIHHLVSYIIDMAEATKSVCVISKMTKVNCKRI
jgi:hypothetical protein